MPTPPVDQTATIAAVRNDASRDGGGFASQLSNLDLETGGKAVADDSTSSTSDSPASANPAAGLSALLAAFNDAADPQITSSDTSSPAARPLISGSAKSSMFTETSDISDVSHATVRGSTQVSLAGLQNAIANGTQQGVDDVARATQSGARSPTASSSAQNAVVQQEWQTPTQQSDTKAASLSSELPLPALAATLNKAAATPPQNSDDDTASSVASLLSLTKANTGSGLATADKGAAPSASLGKPSRSSLRPSTDTPPATNSSSGLQDLATSAQAAIAVLATAFGPPTATTGGTSGTGSQAAAATVGGRAPASAGQSASSKPMPSTSALPGLPVSSSLADSASVARVDNDSFDLSDAADAGSQVVKMHVSSIQAETHLIPVQAPAPAQQVADFIAANAAAIGSGANAGAALAGSGSDAVASGTEASSGARSSALQSAIAVSSPVKILTLTLEPDTLGPVTVTMRLVDSGLSLQLGAAKSDTADLIERDKDKISDSLRSLGYAIDGVEVKTVAAQSSNSTSTNDQAATSPGQPSASDAGASGLSQNGSGSRGDRSSAQARNDTGNNLNQDDLAGSSARRTDGGLYL